MSLLLTDEKTGLVLHAVAIEYWTFPPKSAMMYIHAENSGHARSLLLKQNLGDKARIVSIAPAIGGFIKKEDKIQVFGGL